MNSFTELLSDEGDRVAAPRAAAPSGPSAQGAQNGKYLFDLSFDADAPPTLPEAPPPLVMTPEELDARLAASYADGRNMGRAEALQQGAEHASMQTNRLAQALQAAAGEATARNSEDAETIATAIRAIAQSLLPAYVARHGLAELEAIVRDCLGQLKGETRLVIRVADGELDEAVKRFENLAQLAAFQGKLIILAENTLNPGDIRVEWADGGLERSAGTLWSEIEQILAKATGKPIGASGMGVANPYS